MSTSDVQLCSFFKRLLAISYDLILLFSILFLATLVILPLTNGNAIESGNPLYVSYLLFCSYLYFCWQWMHGGQTLGMRAWRVRLVRSDKSALNWVIVTKRFFLACLSLSVFGLGFIWSLFDKNKLAFHDRFSNTSLIIDKSFP